jgi:hypothetical protein
MQEQAALLSVDFVHRERSHSPRRVAAGPFDFDHSGAKICQKFSAVGTRNPLSQINDEKPKERLESALARVSRHIDILPRPRHPVDGSVGTLTLEGRLRTCKAVSRATGPIRRPGRISQHSAALH